MRIPQFVKRGVPVSIRMRLDAFRITSFTAAPRSRRNPRPARRVRYSAAGTAYQHHARAARPLIRLRAILTKLFQLAPQGSVGGGADAIDNFQGKRLLRSGQTGI